jgi:threonine synthase
MKYISTRGEAPAVTFTEAVLAGLAPDGGLYVPETWPHLSEAEIAAFAGQPYADVAANLLARFAGDSIAASDLQAMCAEAYASFSHPAVVPLTQIAPGAFLLELFHGPTLAFKDVAMQLLARLYDHVLRRQGRRLTIVCATSGDTGGAAVEAFRGRSNLKVVALYPQGRISEIQRRYMTTADEENVACFAVDGTFDDCQAMVKAMFQDTPFAEAVNLSGVNSINFARIAAQSVYYFTAAAALGAPLRPVAFAVPTGNFGDAFAGYAASRMGLPIERLAIAVNSNDIVSRALETGRYAKGEVRATLSPAMDIQIASNFERLYFECSGRDHLETGRAFSAFQQLGAIDIPPRNLAAMRRLMTGAAVSEEETSRVILSTFTETGEMIDPHTAVAVSAAARIGPANSTTPMVALATAHPAKFPETVEAAVGAPPHAPASAAALADKPERCTPVPADAERVKALIAQFARS